MKNFIQIIVCVLLVIAVADGIRFFVRPSTFYAFDTDVKLICNLEDESKQQIATVQTIKIEERKGNSKWSEIAAIRLDGLKNDNPQNLTVNGFIKSVTDSYLMVTWHVASPEKFGRYRCEVVAETPTGSLLARRSSENIISGSNRDIEHLFDLVRNSDNNVGGKVQDALNRINNLNSDMKTQFKQATESRTRLSDKVGRLQTNVESKLSDIQSKMATLESLVRLLQPRTTKSVSTRTTKATTKPTTKKVEGN